MRTGSNSLYHGRRKRTGAVRVRREHREQTDCDGQQRDMLKLRVIEGNHSTHVTERGFGVRPSPSSVIAADSIPNPSRRQRWLRRGGRWVLQQENGEQSVYEKNEREKQKIHAALEGLRLQEEIRELQEELNSLGTGREDPGTAPPRRLAGGGGWGAASPVFSSPPASRGGGRGGERGWAWDHCWADEAGTEAAEAFDNHVRAERQRNGRFALPPSRGGMWNQHIRTWFERFTDHHYVETRGKEIAPSNSQGSQYFGGKSGNRDEVQLPSRSTLTAILPIPTTTGFSEAPGKAPGSDDYGIWADDEDELTYSQDSFCSPPDTPVATSSLPRAPSSGQGAGNRPVVGKNSLKNALSWGCTSKCSFSSRCSSLCRANNGMANKKCEQLHLSQKKWCTSCSSGIDDDERLDLVASIACQKILCCCCCSASCFSSGNDSNNSSCKQHKYCPTKSSPGDQCNKVYRTP